MSSIDEFDDLDGQNEINAKSESDIKSNDSFGDDDYFNNNIEEYKNAEYQPSIDPPKEISYSSKKPNEFRSGWTTNETFMNFNEKFQKIKNEDYNEEEFPTFSAEEMCENHKTTFNMNIDYSSNIYDTFSKNHLRNTLIEQIKKIDWVNQRIKINEAKKETNAYEDINEHFFDKNQGYQLANIHYLFDKNLIIHDNLCDGIPVFIVGDNGGLSDFILYYAISQKGFSPTIYVIPEKNNSIKTAKYRREIKDQVDKHLEILDEFYQENKDLDENTSISVEFINNIVKKIKEKTDGYMVNLYIARKVIKFEPNSSQEIKYKKFLLINILLAFKMLNHEGNFIIKLYDTFTPFTIGLIYIIFKNFESVSIFKPVSTRQYSPCRFLVAENYQKPKDEETNNSIKYLENFLTKYIEFTKDNYDVKSFLPSSELRKNEKFLKIIPEINNGITEKRIDALKEIINRLDNKKTKLYDKMAIKKFFLDNWNIPVINYDEKKLLKNQINNDRGKYDYYHKNLLTIEERAEAYKNIGVFDEDQKKMLNLMKQKTKKYKKKPEVKEETKPTEDLEVKYKRLDELFKMKKNNKKTKKDGNDKDKKSETTNNKYDEISKNKELLKKKIERNEKSGKKEDKKEEKIKLKNKKNKDDKRDFKKDNDMALNELDEEEKKELFHVDEKVNKKLSKLNKKK